MGDITDVVVEGLKYPFNDVNKYLTFGLAQLIMSALFIGAFASVGSYVYQAYSTSVSMGLNTIDLSVVSPVMIVVAVILALLGLVAFVFISGYEFNVLKFSISKRGELPSFKDFTCLLKDGLRLVALQIAYALPPAVLILLGFMLSVNANVGTAVNAVGSFILALAIIFAVVVVFMGIMAAARMADKGTLRSAFDFREIAGLISGMGILQYVGILVFLAIAIAIISAAAYMVFEIIGFAFVFIVPVALVSVFLVIILRSLLLDSFTGIAIYRVFGSVYNIASGNEGSDESDNDDIGLQDEAVVSVGEEAEAAESAGEVDDAVESAVEEDVAVESAVEEDVAVESAVEEDVAVESAGEVDDAVESADEEDVAEKEDID